MKNIYNAILERLQSEVPELKWIDDQMEQMSYEKPPVVFPAALIDIEFPRTENITTEIQQGSCSIVIDFCFDYTGHMTASAYSQAERNKSLKHWGIIEKGEKALQGFETEWFNELERINVRPAKKRPGYKIVSVGFRTSFREAFTTS